MRRHLTLEEISAWFDGEAEIGEIEHRHLRDCAECGAVLDGHVRLRRLARKATPVVPTDEIWRAVSARLAPAPAPAAERAVPASRALVPGRGAAERNAERPVRRFPVRRLRLLASRAFPVLAAVTGITAVFLLVPRSTDRPVPAGTVPASTAGSAREAGTGGTPVPPAKPAATAPAAVDRVPGPSELARGIRAAVARHGRIEFYLGKSTLDPSSEPALREIAALLVRAPDAAVTVEGHTDSTGGTDWNMRISRARADTIVRWLIERGGVPARRLSARGYGGTRPVADNSTEAGRAANRRVEFSVAGAAAQSVPSASAGQPPAVVALQVPQAPQVPPEPAPPRQSYTGERFVLTADRFTTSSPDLVSAAGHVRIEPIREGEPYYAIVDGFGRTLTGSATGIVAEVVNPGERLILHTGAKGTAVHSVP